MPLGGLLPYGNEMGMEEQDGFDMPVMLTAGDITDQQDQGVEGDMNQMGMPPGMDVLARLFGRKRKAPMAGEQAQGGPAPAGMESMGEALMRGFRG